VRTGDPFDKNPRLAASIWTYHGCGQWRIYVEGLYNPTSGKKGTKKKRPAVPAAVSRTKKGTIVFRIKRDPKFINEVELKKFADDLGVSADEIRRLAGVRKIEVRKEA